MSEELTRWRRLGRLYHDGLAQPWMASHGANPAPGEVSGSIVRVYFNCRDTENRSQVAWADIDFKEPLQPFVAAVSPEPVFSNGERGAFDDSGASVGNVVFTGDGARLYYMGWNLGTTVPFRNSIGLAVRGAGETRFRRPFAGPILDRSDADPYTVSYPWVRQEDGVWRMWYGSHTRWGGDYEFETRLMHASSDDGIVWRDRQPLTGLGGPGEYAIARPTVLRRGSELHLWYTSRGENYRIFHARSVDGLNWSLDPAPALGPGKDAWESEAACYPAVFDHVGQTYMLYCGNRYGRDGFGIAVAE